MKFYPNVSEGKLTLFVVALYVTKTSHIATKATAAALTYISPEAQTYTFNAGRHLFCMQNENIERTLKPASYIILLSKSPKNVCIVRNSKHLFHTILTSMQRNLRLLCFLSIL